MAAARLRVNDFARLHEPAQILLPILKPNRDRCVAFRFPEKVEIMSETEAAIEVCDSAVKTVRNLEPDGFIANRAACKSSCAPRARSAGSHEKEFGFAKFKRGIQRHRQWRRFLELPILVGLLRRAEWPGDARG